MKRTLRFTVALIALAGASAGFAQSMESSLEAPHGRYLRGETLPAMPAAGASMLVPGPYAQQLIYLGLDRNEAIAQARARGELPRPAAVSTIAREVSGYDMYARNAMAAAEAARGRDQAAR